MSTSTPLIYFAKNSLAILIYSLTLLLAYFYFAQGTVCLVYMLIEIDGVLFLFFCIMDTPLLSGGVETLDTVITGLRGVMSEFIPYVAHVGLGIIVAVLGFVAIRWLVNWVRAKIFSSF